jgi:phage-related protein (TIGR01555 family)
VKVRSKKKSKHGGPRKGAGRKAVVKPADNVIKLAVDNSTRRITKSSMEETVAASRRKPNSQALVAIDPFKPYVPMPSVFPKGTQLKDGFPIAMDEVIRVSSWGAANVMNGTFTNGAAFIGYPLLSELAQIAEYRKIVETVSNHMTRKFIKLHSVNDDDDKSDAVKQLGDAIENFKVRDVFRKFVEVDGYFGRAHIYLDTGDTDDASELMTPIGNGRDAMSRAKAKGRKALKRLSVIEPLWTYPANYNSSDPLKRDWYNPETWFVQGKQLHRTRLLRGVGREVPDMLKPAYSFGGLSMSQMAMPYIDNWLRTRQSVADLIWSFSVSGLKTNMSAMMQPGAPSDIFTRSEIFNNLRNNRGLMMLDKDTEEFFQFNTPLGTLDMLQAQAQEQMASVSSIPLVFLLGISPHGLNASSEGEIRAFYDFIHSYQMKFFFEPLTRVIDFIQLAIWGKVDPEITFSFEPLWSLDEKGSAEVRKLEAETDDLLINGAIIAPAEARKRVANDPETPYDGLDVEDLPTPPAQELGGKSLDPGLPGNAEPAPGEAEAGVVQSGGGALQ